jgi:hypothetical protein
MVPSHTPYPDWLQDLALRQQARRVLAQTKRPRQLTLCRPVVSEVPYHDAPLLV